VWNILARCVGRKSVSSHRGLSSSSLRMLDVEVKGKCVRECLHAIRIKSESREMRGNSSRVELFCSKQQHADKGSKADHAHADGQSFARALVALALFAFGDAGALSGVVEFAGAFGDLRGVSSHGGDGEG
jgi:hypothetical protein